MLMRMVNTSLHYYAIASIKFTNWSAIHLGSAEILGKKKKKNWGKINTMSLYECTDKENYLHAHIDLYKTLFVHLDMY